MTDTALRTAERAWLATHDDRAWEAFQAALRRAGQPPWCVDCRERAATTSNSNDEPSCLLCREDSLRHGHQQGMHGDLCSVGCSECDMVRLECPDCCETETCPACGVLEATVSVDYDGGTERVCGVCADDVRVLE